jgi:4a-hydroxytetrahydrobiopterin dehydratase
MSDAMNNTPSDLATRHCAGCNGASALPLVTIQEMLPQLKAWELIDGKLVKTFGFKNYYETMAFVNALAWVSHKEDHHPDLLVSYNKCRVEYSTHDAQGITENDFICAAKADALLKF